MMGNSADVILHLEQCRQLFVSPHHVADRDVGVVGNLLGRRQDDELARWPPVEDQRCEHDAGRNGRLPVLFADQQHELADQAPAFVRVVGAEDRRHKLVDPIADRLAHQRAAGGIDHPQGAEHFQGFFGLS
ncbi:hypothetical protein D3C77_616080 [compost metagenome]